ncbi:MAG: IS21-like element helper ATPase IstB [Gammaproteobacteria bacterium]
MEQVQQQLSKLRLHGMSLRLQALIDTRKVHDLSFADGLQLLLQSEVDERDNNRFARLRKTAGFRYHASMEELKYDKSRGIDASLISRLATADYLRKGESLLITGATGSGKSFLASALGHHACVQGYKVLYFNMQKLLLRTKMSRAEGTIIKLFERLAKTDLLILDDFGLTHLDRQQQLDLMEIVEDRHGKKSTLIASQLPVPSWFEIIGEETIADAILDRLINTSYRIELKGESMRKKM